MDGVTGWAETIAACITPPGRGAVAVVRVSGPNAFSVARRVAPFIGEVTRHAYYGRFATGDDGLCTLFAEGASFTGEPTAEISGHGSPVCVAQLLESCYASGARPAKPGEFTLRAFLNGQIDLAQAEGIRETIEAVSARQLDQANRLRQGRLASELAPVVEALRHTLTTVEASTDFSEEIGELTEAQRTGALVQALSDIDRFLATEDLARRIKSGALVVLAGQPNAGKSSLLNALLKSDRAIVNPIAGTTRDTIEEQMELDGIPIRLVDTAGLRNSQDEVEQSGIDRTWQAVREADLVLYLYDADSGWQEADSENVGGLASTHEIVATKSDLATGGRGLPVSSVTGDGLADLVALIRRSIVDSGVEPPSLVERHYAVMREVRDLAQESLATLRSESIPDDLAAVTLRSALRKLGEITGESAPADVLERIFSQFCIGK
ncbi:MAG: tRNA uridine-5-carboxymethylaminomethyl(34) synthesis GTPase MnmE [Armatimonadetes bacterium]|nr:tRNA uridine-5-carboxymethylaminomethyl(34) synthesis GTPase MnmE [Armatimonadota bacterium]